jgi:hypothetical protein
LNLRPLPCQIQRASAGLYIGGLKTGKDRWKAACERRCQRRAASTIYHGSIRVVLIPMAISCCPPAARRPNTPAALRRRSGRARRPLIRSDRPRTAASQCSGGVPARLDPFAAPARRSAPRALGNVAIRPDLSNGSTSWPGARDRVVQAGSQLPARHVRAFGAGRDLARALPDTRTGHRTTGPPDTRPPDP